MEEPTCMRICMILSAKAGSLPISGGASEKREIIPIIDQIPSIPGLYVMLGDSGTSFKTSPAIGKCLAEWILEGKPRTVDLTPFRAARFAEGRPWVDDDNYGRERLTISR